MTRLSFALALLMPLAASLALAVFEIEMPLSQLVKDSQVIAVVTLERVDQESGKGTLKLQRTLQGEQLSATIPIKLIATKEGGGEGNPRDMLDRVQDGARLVLFLASLSPQEHQAFAYGNGSWFKLRGFGELSQVKALFVQVEPNLRKTFHGDDAELAELIEAYLAGKQELPGLDSSINAELEPVPESIAVAPDQIQLGPAWQTEDHAGSASPSATGNYAVAAILLAATLGLAFMLTRSSPGAAS